MHRIEPEILGPKRTDKNVSLLHVTDLHFGPSVVIEEDNKSPFLRSFEASIRRGLESTKIDLIFVTGDILESANWSKTEQLTELEKAKVYLHSLCELCNVDTKRLFIVPGNHDYRFNGLLWKTWARDTFNIAFGGAAEPRFFSDVGLLVTCYDSNASRHVADLATGFVDLAQADALAAQIGRSKLWDQVRFHIVLVHHHVLPVPKGEHVYPSSTFEKVVRKTIVGAPEFMVLRNAGRFVHKLFELKTNLILHGHLHHHGHLRVCNPADASQVCCDVISGGSLIEEGGKHSYGIGTIDTTNNVGSYDNIRFDRDGIPDVPVNFPIGDIELSRRRSQLLCPGMPKPDFKCSSHLKVWQVTTNSGDLLTTELINGVCSLSQSMNVMRLWSKSSALTKAEMKAHSLTPDYTIQPLTRATKFTKTSADFEYKIPFHPQLNSAKPASIVVQRKAEGVIFSSLETQKLWDVNPKAPGEESCGHTVRFVTDVLDLTLRFSPLELAPHAVHFRVLDEKENIVSVEAGSTSVLFNYWPPQLIGGADLIGPLLSAEARLTVMKPKLWHSYELFWRIPNEQPNLHRAALRIIEGKFKTLANDRVRSQVAKKFLLWCLAEASLHIKREEAYAWSVDDTMHACIFGFDEDTKTLKCVVTTHDVCSLKAIGVPWGRDIIGTAHRRGEMYTFDRLRFGDEFGTLNLPSDILYLIAFPLYCYDVDGHPSGILVIASANPKSPLGAVVDRPSATTLMESIYTAWVPCFPALLGLEEN